jgi:HAE1 family hydrophobic/amphiphilic exporter-1
MYNASSGIEVMDMTIGTDEYTVKLEYPEGSYTDMNDMLKLEIATPYGTTITVGDVAEVIYSDVPETLIRSEGNYQVSVTAYATDETRFTASDAISDAVEAAIENGELPEGVSKSQSMMEEMLVEEFTAIGKAIATAVFLIFLVMAMQFESPTFSLMVMLSIPFSLIGSFFLLYIMGMTLDMTALMGVLMLVGIVVNNGILYVDTTNQLKETMPLNEALIESGHIRLRPILMTTLTTILSMVPMFFSTNENAQMMRGMAAIIIGGLITSTLLILLLLPSFYLLMSKQGRAEAKERKRLKKEAKQARKKGGTTL